MHTNGRRYMARWEAKGSSHRHDLSFFWPIMISRKKNHSPVIGEKVWQRAGEEEHCLKINKNRMNEHLLQTYVAYGHHAISLQQSGNVAFAAEVQDGFP